MVVPGTMHGTGAMSKPRIARHPAPSRSRGLPGCGRAAQPVVDRAPQPDLRDRGHGDPRSPHGIERVQVVEEVVRRLAQIAGLRLEKEQARLRSQTT